MNEKFLNKALCCRETLFVCAKRINIQQEILDIAAKIKKSAKNRKTQSIETKIWTLSGTSTCFQFSIPQIESPSSGVERPFKQCSFAFWFQRLLMRFKFAFVDTTEHIIPKMVFQCHSARLTLFGRLTISI